jgi:hypothetical protein
MRAALFGTHRDARRPYRPASIVVDAIENAFVSEVTAGDVVLSAPFPAAASTPITRLGSPAGLAMDPSNHLFVAENGSNIIVEFPPPYTGGPAIVRSGPSGSKGIAFHNIFATTIAPVP